MLSSRHRRKLEGFQKKREKEAACDSSRMCVGIGCQTQSSTVHITWNRSNKVVRLKDLLSQCNVQRNVKWELSLNTPIPTNPWGTRLMHSLSERQRKSAVKSVSATGLSHNYDVKELVSACTLWNVFLVSV
jgi:hypothetical protein